MSAAFAFEHHLDFMPADAEAQLCAIPAAPGVVALRGADLASEPYLTRAADLRRRLRRLLAPPEAVDANGQPVLSRRLNLRSRVRFIDYTLTGSGFESTLVLYKATRAAFGAEAARKRLRLYPPTFLRVTGNHAHPRVYTTNRLSQRSLAESFGLFPSRAAAERYCDAVLDLFQLRRCHEDLAPHPDHAGCAYGEMGKCLAPCKQACTPEQYATEAERITAFFRTRGQSLLDEVAAKREAASEAMDFEAAAQLHKQWEKVRAAALLADELVRPVTSLRALIIQPSAPSTEDASPEAAVFLLEHGCLAGPQRLSTLGVRAVREQTAVGSSLFAQPLMLAPVPLHETADAARTQTPEARAQAALAALGTETTPVISDLPAFCDALALFRRWYYRPEKQRSGEVFLPNPDGAWPIRRILNGAARVVLGPPTLAPAADREAAKDIATRLIHAGREGVEREVAVLPKRSRGRKAVTPNDIVAT